MTCHNCQAQCSKFGKDRKGYRRFRCATTRLTNAFSKKWGNLKAALALYFAYYNFCRVHMPLRVTPAMQSGLTDHVWTLGELITNGGN